MPIHRPRLLIFHSTIPLPQKVPILKISDDVIARDLWFGPPPVADPEDFGGGGMIKILSTKPQKFGCVVKRRVARNSQWSDCFRGLGAEPPALKNFAFFLQK